LEALEGRVVLSTLTVMNNADSGPGSLRAEIAAASSGDTIVFSPKLSGQTIVLTSGDLAVSKNLTINALGARSVTVSGNDASRVFDIAGRAKVALSGLAITGGSSSTGGAVLIESGSTLIITQCTMTRNQAVTDPNGNAIGGAIANQPGASLSIIQSSLFINHTNASNQSYGGALYNQGSATIVASSFSGNQALGSLTSFDASPLPGGSLGGAIMNDDGATMTMSQCIFSDNAASSGSGGDALGGAIDNESAVGSIGAGVSIVNSTFVGNQAIAGLNLGNGYQGAFGGAIEDLPGTTLNVNGTTFAQNQAVAMMPTTAFGSSYDNGGAIDNGASLFFSPLSVNLIVSSSSFTSNVARSGPGLAPGFANYGYGGAVSSNLFAGLEGILTFSNSAFSFNKAIGEAATDGDFGPGTGGNGYGGAIYAGSQLAMVKCWLVGNQAMGGSGDGFAGFGEGGGVDAQDGLSATSCTLIGNSAIGGSGGTNVGRQLFSGYADGGGLAINGTVAMTNCILNANQAIGGPSSAGFGGFAVGGAISAGFNNTTTLTFQGGMLTGNAATGGQGGAGGNGGSAAGGAIDIELTSSADLTGCALSSNSAKGGAGASGGSGGFALGGGIGLSLLALLQPRFAESDSSLILSDSLLSKNQALGGAGESGGEGGNALGGGIGVAGNDTASVTGSVLNTNYATGGGGAVGGNGLGGGFYLDFDTSADVESSSIAGNQALGGQGNTGQGIGGGVYFLGTFTADSTTSIRGNHASTSNNDVYPS